MRTLIMNDPRVMLHAVLRPERAPLPAVAAALYALRRSADVAAHLALALHHRLHPPPVPHSCSGCRASHRVGSALLLLSAGEAVPADLGDRLQEALALFVACRGDHLPTSAPALARAAAVLALASYHHEAALVARALHDARPGHSAVLCESCLETRAQRRRGSCRWQLTPSSPPWW